MIMYQIVQMLLSFYLVNTPQPNARFVDALTYLAGKDPVCAPLGVDYDHVQRNVKLLLAGKKMKDCS